MRLSRRCPATLFLSAHDPILEQRIEAQTGKHVGLIWRCRYCFRVVGTTTLPRNFRLLSELRRQWVRLRAERIA